MKITKRNWFFHLLGLLILVLISMMLAGCGVVTIGGGLILGGVIGNLLDHVIIGIIIGGIIGGILFAILNGGSNSYSSNSSVGGSLSGWAESRKNDPHTCGNCTMYLSRGICRRDNSSKSAGDSCINWN